jgi:hypothetical protein
MAATFTSGYAPAYHKDDHNLPGTAETILFCGGSGAVFGSQVGIARIPFGGCLIMLDAKECGHAACLSLEDAELKGMYAEVRKRQSIPPLIRALLPRQARDKHRKSSKKHGCVPIVRSRLPRRPVHITAAPPARAGRPA